MEIIKQNLQQTYFVLGESLQKYLCIQTYFELGVKISLNLIKVATNHRIQTALSYASHIKLYLTFYTVSQTE